MAAHADPAVSVLMPVRDAADTLPDCLDSIQAQRLADFELLVVDDGSRDASRDLVTARAATDHRIRLLQASGRGLVAALEEGLRSARAPLVARMDADDLMDPERLGLQRDFLEASPDAAVVGSRVEAFPATHVGSGMAAYLRWQNACLDRETLRDEIYVESPLTHPSVMFRRDAVLAAGGYRDGDFPEDYELWLRLDRRGLAMGKIDRCLLRWRQRETSLSRVDSRYSRDAFDRLRARYLAGDPRIGGGRPLVFWGAGRRTRQRARHLMGRGVTPDAWIDVDPRKVGGRLAGVPVEAPGWLRGRASRPYVLSWVATHGARERIGAALDAMGYRRGEDYLAVG